jgi:membrane protein implicated in regulation of membrane protease activity
MIALSLGQAKTVAVLIVIGLIVLAVGSAWLMKTIAQKAALAVILVLLAVLVWTQRSSLDDCADRVRASNLSEDTNCEFFGRNIEISTNRR